MRIISYDALNRGARPALKQWRIAASRRQSGTGLAEDPLFFQKVEWLRQVGRALLDGSEVRNVLAGPDVPASEKVVVDGIGEPFGPGGLAVVMDPSTQEEELLAGLLLHRRSIDQGQQGAAFSERAEGVEGGVMAFEPFPRLEYPRLDLPGEWERVTPGQFPFGASLCVADAHATREAACGLAEEFHRVIEIVGREEGEPELARGARFRRNERFK